MRILLSLLVLVTISLNTFAQTCTPKWPYGSAYGIVPDSVTNLPHAVIGTSYSSPINFRVKKDTSTYYLGSTIKVRIDSIKIDTVTGIPSGFHYSCNPTTCTFRGDSVACVNVYGTAPKGSAGTYPIKVYVTAFAYLPKYSLTVPQGDSITYFRLVIDYPSEVTELTQSDVFITAPAPNPANTESVLNIYAGHAQHIKYMLFDLTGRVINQKDLPNLNGEENIHIPTATLPTGTYIVFVQTNESSYKTRLVVNH